MHSFHLSLAVPFCEGFSSFSDFLSTAIYHCFVSSSSFSCVSTVIPILNLKITNWWCTFGWIILGKVSFQTSCWTELRLLIPRRIFLLMVFGFKSFGYPRLVFLFDFSIHSRYFKAESIICCCRSSFVTPARILILSKLFLVTLLIITIFLNYLMKLTILPLLLVLCLLFFLDHLCS